MDPVDADHQPDCPECGLQVSFGSSLCTHCGQELSWPGQTSRQKSFARPGQEILGCLLVPLASVTITAILVVFLASAFALFGGPYGSLLFGLAGIWLVAQWLQRRTDREQEVRDLNASSPERGLICPPARDTSQERTNDG